ncbi:hypothetical protein MHYP_G00209490 [Metynnis hypsauchen]
MDPRCQGQGARRVEERRKLHNGGRLHRLEGRRSAAEERVLARVRCQGGWGNVIKAKWEETPLLKQHRGNMRKKELYASLEVTNQTSRVCTPHKRRNDLPNCQTQ